MAPKVATRDLGIGHKNTKLITRARDCEFEVTFGGSCKIHTNGDKNDVGKVTMALITAWSWPMKQEGSNSTGFLCGERQGDAWLLQLELNSQMSRARDVTDRTVS